MSCDTEYTPTPKPPETETNSMSTRKITLEDLKDAEACYWDEEDDPRAAKVEPLLPASLHEIMTWDIPLEDREWVFEAFADYRLWEAYWDAKAFLWETLEDAKAPLLKTYQDAAGDLLIRLSQDT